jgi:hypothetical protein
MDTLIHSVHTLLWEYLIGSLVIGPVLAVAVGLIAYVIAIGFHARRSPAPS